MDKKNILLLFGGESPEHEVSIISAKQIFKKINKDKYNIFPIYLDKDHQFKYIPEFETFKEFKDFIKLKKYNIEIRLKKGEVNIYLNKFVKLKKVDASLLTFHGGEGESGDIQGFLNTLKIPYTGPNIKGAIYGIDKIVMKYILEKNNIEILPWMYITKNEWLENKKDVIKKIKKFHEYPLIVKPSSMGSSIGVKKVSNDEDLEEIIDSDILYDNNIIIEKFKDKVVEITYSLIKEKNNILISLSEEIEKDLDKIYSYENKYLQGGKKNKAEGMSAERKNIPANISKKLDDRIKEASFKIYEVLNSQSLVRIDYLVDVKNDTFYTIEINTIPGSLSYYLWEAKGIPFEEMIDKMIDSAIYDFKEQEKILKNIDSPLWNQ